MAENYEFYLNSCGVTSMTNRRISPMSSGIWNGLQSINTATPHLYGNNFALRKETEIPQASRSRDNTISKTARTERKRERIYFIIREYNTKTPHSSFWASENSSS